MISRSVVSVVPLKNCRFSPDFMHGCHVGVLLTKKVDYFFCLGHQHGRYVYCLLCLLGLCENQEFFIIRTKCQRISRNQKTYTEVFYIFSTKSRKCVVLVSRESTSSGMVVVGEKSNNRKSFYPIVSLLF